MKLKTTLLQAKKIKNKQKAKPKIFFAKE